MRMQGYWQKLMHPAYVSLTHIDEASATKLIAICKCVIDRKIMLTI